MSMFIHRCPDCGHAHYEHEKAVHKGSACSFGHCPCPRLLGDVVTQPVELIPRWDSATGEPVARIASPGERLVDHPQAGVVSACDCDACHRAFEEAAA